ncbi:Ribosomal RNA processing Brix domain protein [Klebsormidium nitens]|uniref:Ribosomal RNA processing Brix domain protein n=1 Tax=Klebsormidium nitens TaxID=105231 RepID=A0A1Y1IMV5_KLENI|nr:Ribosomal RNA processing Brix domain protein [Klebsormidium nitens]|eukprot:GAQ92210.1 Ribosomal RNA processing Brix domain protein [Klebsormidium nitens]
MAGGGEGRAPKRRGLPSGIKNKVKRGEVHARVQQEKKKEKKQRVLKRKKEEEAAVALGEAPPPKKIPRTIEGTREVDDTLVRPDDQELQAEEAQDEFSGHFARAVAPKVLVTTCRRPSKGLLRFVAELLGLLPGAHFYKRADYAVKQMVQYATARGFTALLVLHENRKRPNGLLLVSLPAGPTAHFRLSSLKLRADIPGAGRPTRHIPELILNNFSTRLGLRVGRQLASLFPQAPQFRGRRVVTFHNQRDYIFVRHHRYIFEERGGRKGGADPGAPVLARLQECGPRFTLKLLSLQKGTFDSKAGEYEWAHKSDMDTSRRRFFL